MNLFRGLILSCCFIVSWQAAAQKNFEEVESRLFYLEDQFYNFEFTGYQGIKEFVESNPDHTFSQQFYGSYFLSGAMRFIHKEQIDSAEISLDKALYFIQEDDHLKKGIFNIYMGSVLRRKLRYNEAIGHLKKAKEILSTVENTDEWLLKMDLEFAYFYQQQLNIEKAFVLFDSVLQRDPKNIDAHIGIVLIHQDRGDFSEVNNALLKLATMYDYMSDKQKKLFYYFKALYCRYQNQMDSVAYYSKLAENYDMMGWAMSERELYDSAKYYFNKNFEINEYAKDGTIHKMRLIVALAYMDLFSMDSVALDDKMKLLQKEYKHYLNRDPAYVSLAGSVAFNKGEFQKSYEVYREFVMEESNYIEPQFANAILKYLIKIYPELEDLDEALAFNELFMEKVHSGVENKYSLDQKDVFENINRLNVQFLESSRRISEVREELKDQERRAENLRIIALVVLACSIILVLFVIYMYRARNKIKHLNDQLNNKAVVLNQVNEEKDMLLAVVSHQIKAPLANIMYFLDMSGMLVKQGNLDELSKFLDSLGNALKSSYQRAIDVLTWLRIANSEEFSEEALCLKTLVEEVIEFHSEDMDRKRIRPTVDLHHHQPLMIKVEGMKIILQNLIENAIKYSKPGGRIVISDELENHSKRLSIHNYNATSTDQISESHSKSTGMGLLIVKDLCEKLNIKLSYHNGGEMTKVALEF